MDKKSAMRRAKRPSKVLEDNSWDCSVCTYRNTAEAFKCLMCDVRKGTSTRKPRLNQAMVAQQVVAVAGSNSGAAQAAQETTKNKKSKTSSGGRGSQGQGSRGPRRPARLRDVDRSSAQAREVTVNSVTVVITEYKRRTNTSTKQDTSDNEDSSDTKP